LTRFAFAGLLALALTTHARAAFIVTLTQNGPDVVASGSGTLNLAALRFVGVAVLTTGSIFPQFGDVIVGGNPPDAVVLGGITGPATFGSGPGVEQSINNTGSPVGVPFQSELVVPFTYHSGDPLNSSSTFANATLASLGVTPGTYTWTWGTGPTADSFTLIAGQAPPAVPAPPTLLLGLIGAGCVARLRRRGR
jgi:hypothetical protein